MLSDQQKVIHRYLSKYGVRGGSCKTPIYVLYFNYTRFCKVRESEPLSPIEFGRRMSISFVKGKSGRHSYYLTNVEPPATKRRRRIRLWYNRVWARMRNDKKKIKDKIS